MATTLKPVDAVVVGFGWTGAILAKELTEAGLNVVALERGENRDTYPDGAYPNTLDELTYNTRGKLFQNLSKSTVSIRHGINDTALPYRQLSAFLPGDGVGGAGLHWSGVHFRIMPEELRLRSHYEERYGKKKARAHPWLDRLQVLLFGVFHMLALPALSPASELPQDKEDDHA